MGKNHGKKKRTEYAKRVSLMAKLDNQLRLSAEEQKKKKDKNNKNGE